MLHRVRGRLTYANVIATLALFIALGTGGAFAAATITGADVVDGSLTGVDIADSSIKNVDLANGSVSHNKISSNGVFTANLNNVAVTGAKLAPNAVTGDKVADGSLTAADINQSTLTDFMRGRTEFSRQVIPMDGRLYFPGGISGLYDVGTTCTTFTPGIVFDNQTEEPMDVVREDATNTTPTFRTLDPASTPGTGWRWDMNVPNAVNVTTFHISTPSGRGATVWVSSVPRPSSSNCVELVQAVATK